MRQFVSAAAAALILAGSIRAADALPLTAAEIVAKMEASDRARRQAMAGYSSVRHYAVENSRFNVKASMKVEVHADSTGTKSFRILETSGPAAIRKLVFQRMLDTESQASGKDAQASTRISSENYTFRLVRDAASERHYVLDLEPRSKNPLLFRGRIWVDSVSFAVVKMEGAPAQNPSFWVRKTRFVHEYSAVGSQWLASVNRSESEIRMFGRSVVTIQYGDYKLAGAVEGAGGL